MLAVVSQVGFFMLPKDERDLFARLRERGDTRFVAGLFHPGPVPRLVDRLEEGGREIVLVNPAFGVPPRLHERGEGELEGTYTFDTYRDPHIAWSRCRRSGGALLAGRIHAKIGWAKGHDNDLYRRWYDGVRRLVVSMTEAAPARAGKWRIAPEAAAWWRAGNLFCFGDENALRAGPDLEHVPRPTRSR
jgi:hypothetical protein